MGGSHLYDKMIKFSSANMILLELFVLGTKPMKQKLAYNMQLKNSIYLKSSSIKQSNFFNAKEDGR